MQFLGREWSLNGTSGLLLYLLGFVGEVFVLASVYMIMPVGQLSWRHALIGAVVAVLLWELSRHVLLWYFGSMSQISTVYGSLTTAIAVLLNLDRWRPRCCCWARRSSPSTSAAAARRRNGRRAGSSRCRADSLDALATDRDGASGREQAGLACRVEQQRGQRRQLLVDVGGRRCTGARTPHRSTMYWRPSRFRPAHRRPAAPMLM